MIRDTYKGRQIEIAPTRECGIVQMTLNDIDIGKFIGTANQALSGIKDQIDLADANPGRYSAKWYATPAGASVELVA